MKKIFPIILSSLLIFGISGCTPENIDSPLPDNSNVPLETTIPQPEPAPVPQVIPTDSPEESELSYENLKYGYKLTLPEEFADNYDIIEYSDGHTDFVVDGGDDPFMTILSTDDEEFDTQIVNTELLGIKDNITTYKLMPTCGTLNNESYREMWDKLNIAAQSINSENFSYTDGEGIIPEKPIVYEGLSKILYDSRDSEDNEYFKIITPDDSDDMIIELMGLKDVEINNYAISASLMNVHAYGIAIVEAEDTRAVSDGLQSYIDLMEANFEHYLPDQYAIASNTILETSGDYVIMVMCDNADEVSENIMKGLENLNP